MKLSNKLKRLNKMELIALITMIANKQIIDVNSENVMEMDNRELNVQINSFDDMPSI